MNFLIGDFILTPPNRTSISFSHKNLNIGYLTGIDYMQLNENSLFSSQTEKDDFLKDKTAIADAFFVNTIGLLALHSIPEGEAKLTQFLRPLRLRLSLVDDTSVDALLALKLYTDIGGITQTRADNLTKLMVILRNGNAKIDPVKLKTDVLSGILFNAHPPSARVKKLFGDLVDGTIGLPQYLEGIYLLIKQSKELQNVSSEFLRLTDPIRSAITKIPDVAPAQTPPASTSAPVSSGPTNFSKIPHPVAPGALPLSPAQRKELDDKIAAVVSIKNKDAREKAYVDLLADTFGAGEVRVKTLIDTFSLVPYQIAKKLTQGGRHGYINLKGFGTPAASVTAAPVSAPAASISVAAPAPAPIAKSAPAAPPAAPVVPAAPVYDYSVFGRMATGTFSTSEFVTELTKMLQQGVSQYSLEYLTFPSGFDKNEMLKRFIDAIPSAPFTATMYLMLLGTMDAFKGVVRKEFVEKLKGESDSVIQQVLTSFYRRANQVGTPSTHPIMDTLDTFELMEKIVLGMNDDVSYQSTVNAYTHFRTFLYSVSARRIEFVFMMESGDSRYKNFRFFAALRDTITQSMLFYKFPLDRNDVYIDSRIGKVRMRKEYYDTLDANSRKIVDLMVSSYHIEVFEVSYKTLARSMIKVEGEKFDAGAYNTIVKDVVGGSVDNLDITKLRAELFDLLGTEFAGKTLEPYFPATYSTSYMEKVYSTFSKDVSLQTLYLKNISATGLYDFIVLLIKGYDVDRIFSVWFQDMGAFSDTLAKYPDTLSRLSEILNQANDPKSTSYGLYDFRISRDLYGKPGEIFAACIKALNETQRKELLTRHCAKENSFDQSKFDLCSIQPSFEIFKQTIELEPKNTYPIRNCLMFQEHASLLLINLFYQRHLEQAAVIPTSTFSIEQLFYIANALDDKCPETIKKLCEEKVPLAFDSPGYNAGNVEFTYFTVPVTAWAKGVIRSSVAKTVSSSGGADIRPGVFTLLRKTAENGALYGEEAIEITRDILTAIVNRQRSISYSQLESVLSSVSGESKVDSDIVHKVGKIFERTVDMSSNKSEALQLRGQFASFVSFLYENDKSMASAAFDKLDIKTKRAVSRRIVKIHSTISSVEDLSSTKFPIRPYTKLSSSQMSELIKKNKIDELISDVKLPLTDKRIETIGTFMTELNKFPVAEFPKLAVTAVSKEAAYYEKKSVELHAFSAGKHGDIAVKILREFDVALPGNTAAYEAFVASHPSTKFVEPAFHGTSSIAASFILRTGFVIITESSAVPIAGKALGNGIYFSNKIDKATQYIGDQRGSGVNRRYGQRGYLFQMKAALGEWQTNYKSAGTGDPRENHSFVSPEWAVFKPLSQLLITKAYEVELISNAQMKELTAKHAINEGIIQVKTFNMFLEQAEIKKPHEEFRHATTFTFMDGKIPLSDGTLVDWQDFKPADSGFHVALDMSQYGPVVMFYHNGGESRQFLCSTAEQLMLDGLMGEYLRLMAGEK